jgi:hypothetical protein
MAVFNIRRLNENLAKRPVVATNFKVAANLPGEVELPLGEDVTIGAIEGDVVITRVVSVVSEAFNGTAPTIDITDSDSVVWFNDRNLAAEGSVQSIVTRPDGTTIPEPIYKGGKTEFYANVTDGGSQGVVGVVVEFVPLDTTNGLHQGGVY